MDLFRRRWITPLTVIASWLVLAVIPAACSRQGKLSVDTFDPWIGTVKKGSMSREVRGVGTLVREGHSPNLLARVTLKDSAADDVRLNQNAEVDTNKGFVKGHVSYVSFSASNGTWSVDIAFDSALPHGVGANTQVEATIDVGTLENVLYVGRPVHAGQNVSIPVFRIVSNGTQAERVTVKFGRVSVSSIEVLDGLQAGDKIILSDMSSWENFDRIRMK